MLTNLSGTSVGTYTYDVFGDTRSKTGSINNEFQFTGRQWDNETNLYYYRNRYYNPSVGRFITKDPIGLVGGINVYLYAKNNPVNYVDPIGAKPEKPTYFWGPCNAAQMAQCISQCEERGVQSCQVRFKLSVTISNGKPTYTLTELGLSCSCNEEKENPCDIAIGPKPLPLSPIFN